MDTRTQAFTEMRNYYNSITQDNLALIKSLNDEIEVRCLFVGDDLRVTPTTAPGRVFTRVLALRT